MIEEVRSRVVDAFEQRFGGRPRWLVRAPGRVALLGAHVDYVEGWVLAGAIDRAVWLAARPARGAGGVVEALDLDRVGELDPSKLPPPLRAREDQTAGWLDLPRGVAWALTRRVGKLPPLDVAFGSDLPIGAGLSSSAAVEMAFSLAWEAAANLHLESLQRARLGRSVENDYMDVGSGIMDQFTSVHGRAGHLLFLDCRTLEHRAIPLPPGLAVLIVDTGVRRTLADSDYNDRPGECRRAAELLRRSMPEVKTLRDVGEAELERHRDQLSAELLLRARHAIGECRRVREGARALERGDVESFGAAMRASHESSRDLYQVSIPELDLLAETAWSTAGCHGARLSGAGFGGCVTALVDQGAATEVAARCRRVFRERFGRSCSAAVSMIADGARCEEL